MPLSSAQVKKTIEEITHLVDPSSDRYGQLLNWQNPPDPFWHYGIGLSDTHIFDIGQGLCPFERGDANFVVGLTILPFRQIKQLSALSTLLVFLQIGNIPYLAGIVSILAD
jgi:hypothetical protein